MSLREQLKQAAARCAPIDAQLATSAANDATASATPAQQQAATLRQPSKVRATGNATPAQPGPKTSATLPATGGHPSCAAVASELTAHRVMKQLLEAAARACDHWGDDDHARAEMLTQCQETPLHLRAELLRHFEQQYPSGKG